MCAGRLVHAVLWYFCNASIKAVRSMEGTHVPSIDRERGLITCQEQRQDILYKASRLV